MRPDDFFDEVDPDPVFGVGTTVFNSQMIDALKRGRLTTYDDVEVAVALARLVHDELQRYGTDNSQRLTNDEMRDALLSLRATLTRIGLTDFSVPFRDYETFYKYWIDNGAYGSWQARRNLLSKIFDDLHDRLADLELASMSSSLIDPISPHPRTGWSAVDTEISELRRHFLAARTPQDYRNVGNDCVAVTEILSATVYDPAVNLGAGEDEPPVPKTKQRIGRFVDDAAAGPDNTTLRRLATAVIDYAQHVKHSGTPTRREAGIAADAVIQLANILRRLGEPE